MVQAAPSGLRFWLTVDHRTNDVICWNNIFGDFFDGSKISDRHWLTACKHYQKCDVLYRYFHIQLIWCLLMVQYLQNNVTVGTPYNTAPYITGSNMAQLGHGSQNSWNKLWIPIVKSAPVRVIFTWKSVPKKSIHGSSDIYLGTQWKKRHDSPWSYRSDVIVTFLWYGTIGIIWHCDHQSTAKKV